MYKTLFHRLRQLIACSAAALVLCTVALADELPGKGVKIQMIKTNEAGELFQTLLVMKALEKLGYNVLPWQEMSHPLMYVSLANGDADIFATHWEPLHSDYYKNGGGDAKFFKKGQYSTAAQGYLIDKKTAEQYNITNIAQLKDPKLAKLFDTDGDGKADLIGCDPGWGCEAIIEHQLDAYGLRGTVTHRQGSYAVLIADVITRFKAGQPVLYYTWIPLWPSSIMKPGGSAFFRPARRARRARYHTAERQKPGLFHEYPTYCGKPCLCRQTPGCSQTCRNHATAGRRYYRAECTNGTGTKYGSRCRAPYRQLD